CNASGDPPAYTPSVHTVFFAADGRLSCPAESLTLTAIEAAIAAERVKTAGTPRARLISVLQCSRIWMLRCSHQATPLHHTVGSSEPQPKALCQHVITARAAWVRRFQLRPTKRLADWCGRRDRAGPCRHGIGQENVFD